VLKLIPKSLVPLFVVCLSNIAAAQQTSATPPPPPPVAVTEVDAQPKSPDPQIVAALKQISSEHIQATIEKLVSFKNGSTLASND